jgi:hypothetical protein
MYIPASIVAVASLVGVVWLILHFRREDSRCSRRIVVNGSRYYCLLRAGHGGKHRSKLSQVFEWDDEKAARGEWHEGREADRYEISMEVRDRYAEH